MNKEITNKLLKYSAAAGAGAFSLSSASADIVWQADIDGFTTQSLLNGDGFNLDIDGDADTDVTFSVFTGLTQVVRAFHTDGMTVSPSDTDNYYVFGFESGELIDSSSLSSSDGGRAATFNGIARWDNTEGLSTTVPEGYIGIEFDNAGNVHYGWVEVEVSSPSEGALQFDIINYAWENSPGAGITAGATGAVPEPSTYALGLGLLALGAAGIRARRQSPKSQLAS